MHAKISGNEQGKGTDLLPPRSECEYMDKTIKRKVFISYAHTSEPHRSWVVALGTDLQSHGIEVILDRWDLREGQDALVFMESMVNDKTVDRVLMVCDENYAKKADSRSGGVGVESQIISPELYNQVGQTKFIPLLRERDAAGTACLPIFLKSRIYIDFTSIDGYEAALEQLVRQVFDKPKDTKPPLGRVPDYITADTEVRIACVRSLARFKECMVSGRGNPAAVFDHFAADVVADLGEFRMAYSPVNEEQWPDQVLASIERMRGLRDCVIDAVAAVAVVSEDWASQATFNLLEQLVNVHAAYVSENRRGSKLDHDNYHFFATEAFISVIATLLKKKRYDMVRKLLTETYEITGNDQLDGTQFGSASVFYAPTQTLEELCNQKYSTNWNSYTGWLMSDRATRSDIHLVDLVQADALVFLWSLKSGYRFRWWPSVSLHGRRMSPIPMIERLLQTGDISPLLQVIDIQTGEDLLKLLQSRTAREAFSSQSLWQTVYCDGIIYGLDELYRAFGDRN